MPRSRPPVTVPPATIPAPIPHRERGLPLPPIRVAHPPAHSKVSMPPDTPPARVLVRRTPQANLLPTVRPAQRPEAMLRPVVPPIRRQARRIRPPARAVFSRALRLAPPQALHPTPRLLPLPMAVAAIPPHRRPERHPHILPRADTTAERPIPVGRRPIPVVRTLRAAPVAVQVSRPAVARRVVIRSRELAAVAKSSQANRAVLPSRRRVFFGGVTNP